MTSRTAKIKAHTCLISVLKANSDSAYGLRGLDTFALMCFPLPAEGAGCCLASGKVGKAQVRMVAVFCAGQ